MTKFMKFSPLLTCCTFLLFFIVFYSASAQDADYLPSALKAVATNSQTDSDKLTFISPSRSENICYIVNPLAFDSGLPGMRSWLGLYGAQTQVMAAPITTFLLYIPPLANHKEADIVVLEIKEKIPAVRNQVSRIINGTRRNGVQLGEYAGMAPPDLLQNLKKLGYDIQALPLYSDKSLSVMLIRHGGQVDVEAFRKRFSGHMLVSTHC